MNISSTDLDTGVAATLARARAQSLGDIRYSLRFRIPASLSEKITGSVTASFATREPLDAIVLDFAAEPSQVRTVSLDDDAADARLVNEHLVIRTAARLIPGAHHVSVDFVAGDASLNRHDDYLYTLFVPARARLAFPCFDQPDLKARVALTLDVPAGWQTLANGAQIERADEEDRTTIRFAETPPLPTYLVAFAAGKLSIETAERNGRTFRMFHRETDAKKVARNRDAIFDLHAAALAWLEDYTGIPYPWGKFDFFLVPAFQFGGMEHAGAIFYNAPGLMLDETATTNQLLGRASVIAHETSHMWFGDLVTMRWFDDVWMKEVFANFMAAKIVNPSFPTINHDLRFLLAHYPAAYDVDRTPGTHPIRQPLENLRDAGTLYGAIIYQKAPIAMRQLERLLGEASMRDGLREYLQRFRFTNATWLDLIRILDERTPDDLAAWSKVWIEDLGRPVIRTVVARGDDGGSPSITLEQMDPAGRDRIWPQLLDVVVGSSASVRTCPVRISERHTDVATASAPADIAFVLPSGGGLGYGGFVLDVASRDWLMAHLPEVPDALTRGSAWVTLWDEMLDAHVSPAALADLALHALPRERDELNLQRVLGYLESVFWRFSTPEQRRALSIRVDATLADGLQQAPAGPVKAAWFQAWVRTATTGEAVARMERVWRGDERIDGLTLAEPDLSRLAQELAVRGVPNADEILATQLKRIENPDRRARFDFVRPALSADPAERAAFFQSLADVGNRRHEPWVLDALGYLHHPLRAADAERYVLPSLEWLETIQRTGDIFFPKRWMDATLSGHQSSRVARTVDLFLHANPDYPLRLRRIILQSADDLFRAAQILQPRESINDAR